VSYRIATIAPFRKEAKRLIKKFPSLKHELANISSQLSIDPTIGTSLGNNCYKIRLAIASKGTGKAGGARVITHFYVANNTVFLLFIDDKSDQGRISDSQIKALLALIE